MADTRRELVTMLETAEMVERDFIRRAKIRNIRQGALRGEFHDFKSPYTFPKLDLVEALEQVGLEDIIKLIEQGEFDEMPDGPDLRNGHIKG